MQKENIIINSTENIHIDHEFKLNLTPIAIRVVFTYNNHEFITTLAIANFKDKENPSNEEIKDKIIEVLQ